MQETAHLATRRRRPRAVSFVGSLLLIEAVLVVLAGIVSGAGHVAASTPAIGVDDVFGPTIAILPGLGVATVIVVVGGGLGLAGLGLLQTREWGWVLAMALQGLGLANALYAHAHGDAQYLTLALCSFVVLVLNQREVRHAFAARATHV